ncbi:hypothetical protein NXS19_003170 [Fusarium pseudograminearum]|nr:hypothetical protein NXS19_003170 [Fusarium pseudograminearum]
MTPPKPICGEEKPQARERTSVSYEFVLEDEFDALCVEVKRNDGDSSGKSSSGNKYPAKLHARKVVKELSVTDGLIYLPGEPTRLYEDSDQSPPFKQRRYFYYMSGANFPDCVLTYDIATDRLILWIPYAEPRQVLYHGPTPDAAEAMRKYDVDDVRYTAQLQKFLHSQLRPERTLYVIHTDQAPKLHDRPRGQTKINCSKLRPAMDQARVIKTEYEVALIRRAARISAAAHRAVAERLLTMRNEQDVAAVILAACTSLVHMSRRTQSLLVPVSTPPYCTTSPMTSHLRETNSWLSMLGVSTNVMPATLLAPFLSAALSQSKPPQFTPSCSACKKSVSHVSNPALFTMNCKFMPATLLFKVCASWVSCEVALMRSKRRVLLQLSFPTVWAITLVLKSTMSPVMSVS